MWNKRKLKTEILFIYMMQRLTLLQMAKNTLLKLKYL